MKEKIARALGLMVEAVAVTEFGYVGVDQPDFLLLHLGIAFGDRAFAEAERLHLGAGERDAGFIFVLDGIIVARAPVLGDDLLLVETLGARTGPSDAAGLFERGVDGLAAVLGRRGHGAAQRGRPFRAPTGGRRF